MLRRCQFSRNNIYFPSTRHDVEILEAIQRARHSDRMNTLLKGRCKAKATFLGAREFGYRVSE